MFAKILKKYDPTERRDENGRWARTMGVASTFASEHNKRDYSVGVVISNALNNDPETIKRYYADIESINTDVGVKLMTNITHSKNGDGTGGYTKERITLHNKIVDTILANADAARAKKGTNPTLYILGGRGGSGKSNFDVTRNKDFGVYNSNKTIVIDSDAIKEMLPEYNPAKAYLTHSESAHIADRILSETKKNRLNTVVDITLRTSHVHLVKRFTAAGFDTEAHFMHKSPEGALTGAVKRWNNKTIVRNPLTKEAKEFGSGRLVPPKVIEANINNESNFDLLTKHVKKWSLVTNKSLSGFNGEKVAQSIKKLLSYLGLLKQPVPAQVQIVPVAHILKYNQHHDEKGRFSNADKIAYHATKLKNLAVMLGAPEPKYAKPYYDLAITGGIKAAQAKLMDLGEGGLATAILTSYQAANLFHDVWSKPITEEEAVAMKSAAKYKKFSATNLKKLEDTDYPKAYNEYMDSVNSLGANHPLTKKAQKKVSGWVIQAEMYSASNEQIAAMVAKTSLAYQMGTAPASKPSANETILTKYKEPGSEYQTTIHYEELALQYHHVKYNYPEGSKIADQAADEAKKARDHLISKYGYSNNQLSTYTKSAYEQFLTDSGMTAAAVPKPAPKPAPVAIKPFYVKGANKADTLKNNEMLGAYYYKVKAELGQAHADVQAAHAQWEKTKTELKNNYGYSTTDVAELSGNIKDKAKATLGEATINSNSKHGQHLAGISSEAQYQVTGGKDLKALDKLINEAKAAGVSQAAIDGAIHSGETKAKAVAEQVKTGHANSIKSAASNMYQAIEEHGEKSEQAAKATIAFDGVALSHQSSFTSAEIKALKQEGLAHVNKMGEAKKLLGDLAGVASKFDTMKFGSIDDDSYGASKNSAAQNKKWNAHHNAHIAAIDPSDKSKLVEYTGSEFVPINRAIGAHGSAVHSGENPTIHPDIVPYAKAFDRAFENATLGQNLVLVRNMKAKWLEEQLGVNLDKVDPSAMVGRSYIEHAYSSTSTRHAFGSSYSSGSDSEKVKLVIRAPATAKAINVRPISSHKGEDEVVLGRGATYMIRRYDSETRELYVDLLGTIAKPI